MIGAMISRDSGRPGRAGFVSSCARVTAVALAGLFLCQSAWAQAAQATQTAPAALATHNGLATAPTAGSTLPSQGGSIMTTLLGLVAVIALMVGVAWLVKRAGLTRTLSGNAPVKVVGGVSVGTRERVMVVEVDDQWIVVGVAPGRVNALMTMPRQEHAGAQPAQGGGPAFATWLKHTVDKRNSGAVQDGRPGNDGNTR